MKARTPVILVGTHLLALGAGWWSVENRDPTPAADPRPALAGKLERPPRQERRVSTADLLAAYGNSELWGEVMKRRNEASRPPETPPNGTPAVYIPPDKRAAEIADIPGAMQKELEAVDAGKTYDYQLAKSLVARWMTEDPAACAAWLGQMKMRVGWGDPFVAFAKTRPPEELLALMDRGWLQVNRRRALDYLADHLGESSAAELPAVLSRLGAEEAKAFLQGASGNARAEDAAVWMALLEGDKSQLQSLANQWLKSPGEDLATWQEEAEFVLAAAAGTPAEEIFQKRWETVQRQVEKERVLARVAHEPAEATAALVGLYLGQGHDEAEARRLATQEISQSYQNGLEVWQREAWEQDLQLSLLGQRKLDDVLAGRLEAIEAELPEVLQAGTRNQSWREAMIIDPATTLEVARQQGLIKEALGIAITVVGNHEASLALQAEVLLALAEQGLWEQGGKLPSAGPFIAGYLRDDPEAARLWMARLPSPLSEPVKEGGR